MTSQDGSSQASTSYQIPEKRVVSSTHLAAFKRSQTHHDVFDFIQQLNEEVAGKTLSQAGEPSKRTRPILEILDRVQRIAEETPPVDNTLSRFGNPAFKSFYDKVARASSELHSRIPGLPAQAVPEIEVYFKHSWGSKERIDYGSGMELNFVTWLFCMVKLNVFNHDDFVFLVLGIFWRYIKVMRYLQSTYWLEPAGSHGVWGLDDYHFLPFLWGSAQLRDHKHLRPKAIHDEEILEAFAPDYMYLSSIAFINSIKTASLRWHSPMLDDISAVKTWSKVNSGMLKMYDAEVLGKLPVMQHAFFGSIVPFPKPSDDPLFAKALEEEGEETVEHEGHVHEKGWQMDCCGIPVPSAFAQAQAESKGSAPIAARTGLRPIPFD